MLYSNALTDRYPKPLNMACSDWAYVTVITRVAAYASKMPDLFDQEDMDTAILDCLKALGETPIDLAKHPLTQPVIHLKRVFADREFRRAAGIARKDYGEASPQYARTLLGAGIEATPKQLRIDCDRLLDETTRPHKAYRAITGVSPTPRSKAEIYKTLIEADSRIETARSIATENPKGRSGRSGISAMTQSDQLDPYLSQGITFNSLALDMGLAQKLADAPVQRAECLRLACVYATKSNRRMESLNEEKVINSKRIIWSLLSYLNNHHYFGDIRGIKLTTPRKIHDLAIACLQAVSVSRSAQTVLEWVGNQDRKGQEDSGYWQLITEVSIAADLKKASVELARIQNDKTASDSGQKIRERAEALRDAKNILRDIHQIVDTAKLLYDRG